MFWIAEGGSIVLVMKKINKSDMPWTLWENMNPQHGSRNILEKTINVDLKY
jgi:hypothetical protein